MIYIGIDPGKSGAVALLDSVFECPRIISVPLSGKEYDIGAMADIVRCCSDGRGRACIERVHAMPKQGRTSMLTIGYGAGLWQGILGTLLIPFRVVSARTWQKEMLSGVGGDTKAASIIVARRLFPGLDLRRTPRCTKIDHNITDALLMAEWLRRNDSSAGAQDTEETVDDLFPTTATTKAD